MTMRIQTWLLWVSLSLWPALPAHAEGQSAHDTPRASETEKSGAAGLSRQFNALLKDAEDVKESNPELSQEYAERALQLAETMHSFAALANAFNAIGEAHTNQVNYRTALSYHVKSLEKWTALGKETRRADVLLDICIAYWKLSEYEQAMPTCLDSLRIYENQKNLEGTANALHHLGIINDLLLKYEKALDFHHRALTIRESIEDDKGIADSLNNIGIMYYFQGNYEEARKYHMRALKVREEIGDPKGIAKSLTNVGLCYKGLEQPEEGLKYSMEALERWKQLGDKYETANVFNNIGEFYTLLRDFGKAAEYLQSGLDLAEEAGAKELQRENYDFWSKLYVARNDYKQALEYANKASAIKDQIHNEKSNKAIADMQTKYETEKKEKEIELLVKNSEINRLQRNSLVGGLVLVFIIAFVIYGRYRFSQRVNRQLEEANNIIHKEKEKSDKLLLNILPSRVAYDLKETGKTEPQLFENVTVYFSDVVGFTSLSSELEPKMLIAELNEIFTAFDNIIEQNGCERVKTIGDAYLCLCGMPEPNSDHAENVVRSAVQIIHYMNERNRSSTLQWQIRIGIHTGKVVGGVVGVKKYIYDVFGDTINTASRMESNSDPMHINISEVTYELVKDKFKIIPRGVHDVKGKGQMNMYFVEAE